jgi:hypothetical protein
VASASGGGHIFQRGGTTQFMTDSSGNLGLGVTPSAWNASYKAFQFGAGSSLAGHTTNTLNFTVLASNQYLDAAGAAIFINNGYAPRYLQRGDTGEHYWYTTNNGSAGGTVTNTQAMTLDASGNLLVGKTSLPSGKLDVAATRSASVVTGWFGTIGTGVVGDINQVLISNVNTLGGQNQGVGIGGVLAASASNEAHLTFYSNAGSGPTERARITSGGYFKASNSGTYVNSTSAYHELYSIASGDWIAYFTQATATNPNGVVIQYTAAAPNGTGNTFLYCQDNAAVRATIRSNGGLANYQSNNVDLSDIRTKTDINPLGSYWNKIAGLEIVTYKYRDQTHDDPNIGVIAQQVEQVAPEFVDPDGFGETPEDGVPLKTIYNKDLTFAAIKALQEAMARIEQLEAKVAALEAN